MLFNKRPALTTPMDHFLHRDELSEDERSVLDVYMTGVAHTLAGINAVRISNAQDPIFSRPSFPGPSFPSPSFPTPGPSPGNGGN